MTVVLEAAMGNETKATVGGMTVVLATTKLTEAVGSFQALTPSGRKYAQLGRVWRSERRLNSPRWVAFRQALAGRDVAAILAAGKHLPSVKIVVEGGDRRALDRGGVRISHHQHILFRAPLA